MDSLSPRVTRGRVHRIKMSAPNPFAVPALVAHYEAWYQAAGRRADHLEKALLKRLLAGFPQASTILEVGCGTGHFTRWFAEQGLQGTGLDLSRPMLAEATRLGSPPCVQGDALVLPCSTGAFDLVALVTTLEFVPEPVQALTEALRVARQGLVLGVLNRQSLLGQRLRREGGPIWGVAQFFTPVEMSRLVHCAAAGRPVETVWQTTLWPVWSGMLPLPWGGLVGMAVTLP
ncbi:MAG: class I SAM-dependent methyltransferase [Anaerolineae bacterium]|jgi:SAM-dependent methyltransferase